jgi:hypothetical protein
MRTIVKLENRVRRLVLKRAQRSQLIRDLFDKKRKKDIHHPDR